MKKKKKADRQRRVKKGKGKEKNCRDCRGRWISSTRCAFRIEETRNRAGVDEGRPGPGLLTEPSGISEEMHYVRSESHYFKVKGITKRRVTKTHGRTKGESSRNKRDSEECPREMDTTVTDDKDTRTPI